MAIDIASQSMFDLYAEVPLPDTYGGHDLLNGDSLALLDLYPENTFHSVVTDPPYGFGKVNDIAALVYAWLTDADPTKYVTKGGFMGQAWDKSVPQPALWKKVYRVLRPGGYCAAFCGARTQDLMGLSLRLAGFEIRDCIYWIYGSGYPKVHDISKAIDAKLGAVRAKKRYEPRAETSGTMSGKGESRPWIEKSREDGFYEADDDQPVSAEAKQWDGWKNLLKPGIEIIILAQKPLEKGLTIAENVLKWGTGGLNIGAVSLPRKAKKWSEPKGGIWSGSVDNDAVLQENTDGGYPPNVIYSHTIFCTKSGTKKIKGTANRIGRAGEQGTAHMQERPWMQERRDAGLPLKEDWQGFSDADGNEEVDAWDCHPNCPILALDMQSGNRKSGVLKAGTVPRGERRTYSNDAAGGYATPKDTFGDEGGASRYFTQFGWTDLELSEWDSCFQYIPKPVKSEKNRGLKGLPKGKKVFNGTSDKSTESPKGVERKFSTEPQENTHTTVKPVAVFQWLIRLLTMPGGKVLDPFMGSGTSAIPAIALGFQYTGIELDETYFKICQGRVACALRDKSRVLV